VRHRNSFARLKTTRRKPYHFNRLDGAAGKGMFQKHRIARKVAADARIRRISG
jgi:hypothetical protein